MKRTAHWMGALALVGLTGTSARSQITTTVSVPPAQVVQNVLLGPGVSASNITFTGDPDQLGTFNCVNCSVGIPSGMVMCTGTVSEVIGPNNNGGYYTGGGNYGANDPDLDAIAGPFGTNDRAALEFDLIPTGDSIKFNFVFGSEEYLEYVNSINDVFGFFLSGPGIAGPYTNGAINIALVPGTAMAVSINNVNNVMNPAYYVDNGNGITSPYNVDPFYIQFDGFTTVLTAQSEVICGETYHIKLVIADYSDAILDSGVFIEAGSFQSNLIHITSDLISGAADSVLYEGCGQTNLIFARAGDLADSLVVSLVETGTATNGVDHTLVPDTLIFVPGEDSVILFLEAYYDGIIEGMEQVVLTATYDGQCASGTTDIVFYIDDPIPINLSLSNDTTLTCNDSTLVQAQVSGGFGALHLDWDTGIPDGSASGWVHPAQTTTYTLTVTDDCGVFTEQESVTITIPIVAPLVVQAAPDTLVFCPESPVQLEALVQGGTPAYTYAWSLGLGSGATAIAAPPTTQTYTLTVTDDCGVDTTDQVTVTVQYDSVLVHILPDTTICNGDTITMVAIPSLGWGGHSLLWDDGSTAAERDVHPASNTIYDVTVTDGCGISASDAAGVGVNSPTADFTYTGSVYVENFPVQFLDLSLGAVQWSWDFGYPDLLSDEPSPVIIYPGDGLFNVMLAITDPLGCVDTTYRTIFINPEFQFYAPSSFTPDGNGDNDVFGGMGVGIDAYQMRIYDRWGEIIYETAEPFGTWDGIARGSEAPTGVYVYWFRLHSISGRSREFTGHVTLLR